MFVYEFVYRDLGVEIFLKKWRATKKKGALILKQEIETYLHTCIGFGENFMQSLSIFLLFFWWQQKIAFKSSIDLSFQSLIVEFFSFA